MSFSIKPYVMPVPTTIVVWRYALGAEPIPAIVTMRGKSAISVMLFPPDSRVCTPKDAVMHISDPRAKTQANPDSGLWDYTDEYKHVMSRLDALSDEK